MLRTGAILNATRRKHIKTRQSITDNIIHFLLLISNDEKLSLEGGGGAVRFKREVNGNSYYITSVDVMPCLSRHCVIAIDENCFRNTSLMHLNKRNYVALAVNK